MMGFPKKDVYAISPTINTYMRALQRLTCNVKESDAALMSYY